MARYTEDKERSFDNNVYKPSVIVRDLILSIVTILIITLAGCPQYNVWEQGLAGKAALKRAEQDRQIAIQEAKAKEESAELLASAEVKRAIGVAEANEIISDGLGGPEGYLRYLYIDAIQEHAGKDGMIIYVATEAGLPILEASRLSE